jgi:hypothetical protein
MINPFPSDQPASVSLPSSQRKERRAKFPIPAYSVASGIADWTACRIIFR